MTTSLLSTIEWICHSAFRIQAEPIIYIDPYEISHGPKADIILISHSHYDHCSPEDVKKIQKKETIIITEKSSVKKLSGDVRQVQPGDSVGICGVKIEAVPAYNLNKTFHPKKNGWLGFIIDIQGQRIYHAGDTDLIPEMEAIMADIALLPVSGTFVMTAEEAVQAALLIKPKVVIPMHYGNVVGDVKDAQAFKKGLKGKIEVVIPEKL
ncbi:MAG: MBL fold metallo-hydrolase [Proteobacteria bacterium]|nr:MBL fold metallo-hydrolase [Pseudomonadota bacterium]